MSDCRKITQQQLLINILYAKLIRENVEYAYFDNALWDLVQDQEMRNHFRTIIENCYLN